MILIEIVFVIFYHYLLTENSWIGPEMIAFIIQCFALTIACLSLLTSWKFNQVNPNEVASFYNQTFTHGEH